MSKLACWIGLVLTAGTLQAQDVWQHVTKPLLPCEEIQLIKAGDKGEIWIGMPQGLAKIESGVLRMVKEANKLSVWDVTPGKEGGTWIGHGGGALLLNGEQTASAMGGLNVASIQGIDGTLWAIAKDNKDLNTLMQASGNEWKPVALGKKSSVLDLVRDAKGTFWIILDGDGVLEVDPKKDIKDARHHMPRMNVTSIMTDSQGRTWCGLMSEGVMMRQNNEWKHLMEKEKQAVLSLLEDKDGKIWAATSGNGIWIYDGKTWSNMQEKETVSFMKATSDKRIWVSTSKGGLRCWNGTEWKDSLTCAASVNRLVELPKGVLLAGTSQDGMYVLGDYSIKGEASDGKANN
jgi:ligand-binding sensor domain-containing protein